MKTVIDTSVFIDKMEGRLTALLERIKKSHIFSVFSDPDTPLEVLKAIMREIHLDIYHYQPHTTEAVFRAIGRMYKDDETLIKDLISLQVEEVEHANMSLRDYIRLGGREEYAKSVRMSPEAFAVVAVKHFLARHEHPASYLGFMFLFEALTVEMSRLVLPIMQEKGFPKESREFIDLHAVEDIRHTDIVLNQIQKVVDRDPTATEAIAYGFDCFAAVYPLPLWEAAYKRATAISYE